MGFIILGAASEYQERAATWQLPYASMAVKLNDQRA